MLMRPMLMRLTAVLLGSLAALPCAAGVAKIGQTSITLTVPAGQCELDRSQPADGRMLLGVEKALVENRLLAAYADCKQLTDWRAGKRGLLEDFAQYQTSVAAVDAPPPADPVEALKQICAKLRAEGEKLVSGVAPDMKSRVEKATKEVKVNQSRFMGVVAEEPTACYGAVAQRFKAETGKDVTIIGLFATTYVKGKLVYYYLFAPYRSAQTLSVQLAKHKPNVAALLAANKN